MTKAVVSYDKDLPEIPERQAHMPLTSYFRKKEKGQDKFEIVEDQRPSELLMIRSSREAG